MAAVASGVDMVLGPGWQTLTWSDLLDVAETLEGTAQRFADRLADYMITLGADTAGEALASLADHRPEA